MSELTDIKGVSDSRADDLRDEDFISVDDVATASVDELSAVSGIGSSTAGDLIESAQDVIREDTLDTDDSTEEETEEEAEDDGEEEGIPELEESDDDDVTEEDLEELLEEDEIGEQAEPEVEDDDGEPEEVDVTPDTYELTISIGDADSYDYFTHAVISMRVGDIRVDYQQEQVALDILEQLRQLEGSGEVTLELSKSDLNSLHAVLSQAQTSYKTYGIEAHNAIRSIREQVQEVREQF